MNKQQNPFVSDGDDWSDINPNTARLAAKGNVKDVLINDLTIAISGIELLTLATLRIYQGHRYGIVGRNGIGKSTLLRRIANKQIGGFPGHLKCVLVEQEMSGSDTTVLESVLHSDKERRRLLQREDELTQQRDATAPKSTDSFNGHVETDLATLYEALADIDADGAPSRAVDILDEFEFPTSMHDRPTSELSGGWRMRLALAAAVFQQPDILLLDEPTNHLDLEFILFLTDYLRHRLDPTVSVLVVSHDRTFLSAVTTDIIHFYQCQLHYYVGNFDTFLKTREESNLNIRRQQDALDAKRQHIKESIVKIKTAARKTGHSEQNLGIIASREKKLGRMGFEKTADGKKFNAQQHGRRVASANDSAIGENAGQRMGRVAVSQIEPPEKGFKFLFPQPDWSNIIGGFAGDEKQDAILLTLKNVSFAFEQGEKSSENILETYQSRVRIHQIEYEAALLSAQTPPSALNPSRSPLLFSHLNITIRAGDKIGVVGCNGVGKSSFLQLLTGSIPLTRGELMITRNVRIAYFTQEFVDQLDHSVTPVQHLLNKCPFMLNQSGSAEQNARAILGRFGLGGSLALQTIGTLSGGQKARVVFAVITCLDPHLIVMDEPTNHLDFMTIAALMDAVNAFNGAVIIVSHDQSLMEICQQLWLIEATPIPKQIKLNPNQIKSNAVKLAKQKAKELSNKKTTTSGGQKSTATAVDHENAGLTLPARAQLRKLNVSFPEYRHELLAALSYQEDD